MKSKPLSFVNRNAHLLRWTTFVAAACCLSIVANAQTETEKDAGAKAKVKLKTKAELKKTLTKMQYYVTQEAGTEPAFRNVYWNNKKEGTYKCICCGNDLFSSTTKYKSGTGWPSFYDPLNKDSVDFSKDWKLFYTRIEVHCKRCKAHLGHVFDDGPKPTGKRYCMNSASLKFVEKKAEKKEDSAESPTAATAEEK